MLFVARASPIPWSDTISPKGMLFFSPYRYRGQLYSIIYGQATPSVIGQKSMALTVKADKDMIAMLIASWFVALLF